MGTSQFLLQEIKDLKVSEQIIEALQKEEEGIILDDLLPQSDTDTEIVNYLKGRYNIYKGIYNFDFSKSKLHWLNICNKITWCEILVLKGDYHSAQQKITQEIVNIKTEYPYLSGLLHLQIGLIWHDLGNYNEASAMYEKALESIQSDIDYSRAFGLIGLADVRIHTGKYDEAEKLLSEASFNTSNKYILRYLSHIKGLNEFYKSNPEEALRNFERTLEMIETYDNDHLKGRVCYSLSELYYSMGDFKKAKEFLDQSKKLLKKVGNERDYSYCFMMENMLFTYQNKYNYAIDAIEKAISLLEKVGNKQDLASCYHMKGETLVSQSNIPEAIRYFKMSLSIKEEIGNPTLMGISLFQIIIQSLIFKVNINVDNYTDVLSNLAQSNGNNFYVNLLNDIITAYRLKNNNNLVDSAKAKEIFERIKNLNKVDYGLYLFVMTNLCDLLIIEYKLIQSNELLDKLEIYIKEILNLAIYNQDNRLIIDMRILQSRLNFAMLKIENAHYILQETRKEYTDFRSNSQLLMRIENEISILNDQTQKLMVSINKEKSLNELMETMKIRDYLNDLSNRYDFKNS